MIAIIEKFRNGRKGQLFNDTKCQAERDGHLPLNGDAGVLWHVSVQSIVLRLKR